MAKKWRNDEGIPWYVEQRGRYNATGHIDKEALKRQVDIEDVLDALFDGGYSRSDGEKGWRSVRCPFHGDTSPSAAVLRDGSVGCYFHCYVCDVSGDIFGVVEEHLGLSFKDAMEWVNECN